MHWYTTQMAKWLPTQALKVICGRNSERGTIHGGKVILWHNTTQMGIQKITIHGTKYDPWQSFKKWSQKG